jgi:hypothetical protein
MFPFIQSHYVYYHSDWLHGSQVLIHHSITIMPDYLVVVVVFEESKIIFVNKYTKWRDHRQIKLVNLFITEFMEVLSPNQKISPPCCCIFKFIYSIHYTVSQISTAESLDYHHRSKFFSFWHMNITSQTSWEKVH